MEKVAVAKVILSPRARELRRLQATLALTDGVRAGKVARLKQTIANGTYWTGGGRAAAGMIKHALIWHVGV